MSGDGFIDFSFGSGDEVVGKKGKRFKAEKDRSYRVTFCWFRDLDASGAPVQKPDNIRFTGCQRIYKQGVGYILYKGPQYAEFGAPKQTIATVICVWPTDKDGQIDINSFKAGTGWSVMPWMFDPEKYNTIKNGNKRFPLIAHDLGISCSDAQFQKLTFTPEPDNLLLKMLNSSSQTHKDIARKIIEQARQIGEGLNRDLARDLTVDEVRIALGGDVAPTGGGGGGGSVNVDSVLDSILED